MTLTSELNKKQEMEENAQPISIEEILQLPVDALFAKLNTSASGLSTPTADGLLQIYGHNEIAKRKKRASMRHFLSHFSNPLILILLVAGTISGFLGILTNSVIIYAIVLMSIILTFFQESKAEKAADALRERVATTATVLRDNIKKELKLSDIVPGDIVILSGGDLVPADSRVISAKDFFVDQSALTGESYPVEKTTIPPKGQNISDKTEWNNYIFMGTSVVSGAATAVVAKTGSSTEYGKIVKSIIGRGPETEFERGLRRFGYLIMEITFLLVIFVFFILALYQHNILDSLLFAVALAVGLTPELLPMILTVNLSKGATEMSRKGVIVKHLASIQNFGNMDVLCTDKTGTLTENKVTLILHVDLEGRDDEKVLLYSFLNSFYQTGLKSPLDEAILDYGKFNLKEYQKIDEVPFDFTRRRVSVVVDHMGERFFITKGAPEEISKVCLYYEHLEKVNDMSVDVQRKIEQKYIELSTEGFRVLGISYKRIKEAKPSYSVNDESEMVFLGFIAFMDPPKETAKESTQLLRKEGIELKILTGDNELVTRHTCQQLGFEIKGVVLGRQVAEMNDDALSRVVEEANIFARVTPAQKNRIMNALKSNKHVVGFLGDGINDSPSMRVSDVSISVNNAVDVAKESADIILLHKDLTVLGEGATEGRKTFGNTMKYVQMAISSNFGNMFSAAGASIFLPFLPMLPIQILLNNFLYDMSELAITTDNVDKEYIEKPKRLDVPFIRRFMVAFGPISSIFDFLTFFIMLYVFNAWNKPALFQTAWFIESLCTQTLVIFVIRTRKMPFFNSVPSKPLLLSSLAVVALAILLPFTIVGEWFQFIELPPNFYLFLLGFIVAYLILVEVMKRAFYRRHGRRLEQYA
jgi:Mg2+-importing ATPase